MEVFEQISLLLKSSSSPEFCLSPGAFSREGPLSRPLLLTLLLVMVADSGRRGYARLLEHFWGQAEDHDLPLPRGAPPSAAAFCKARQKVDAEALRFLNAQVFERIDDLAGSRQRWRGHRVFAFDVARIPLRRSGELWGAFGSVPKGSYPMMSVGALYHPVMKTVADVVVGPYEASERGLLRRTLHCLRPGDLVLLDRGFPSYDLLRELQDRGVFFIARCPNIFSAVAQALKAGARDRRVTLLPTRRSADWNAPPLDLRLVVRRQGHEEPWVLLTNLPEKFSGGDVEQGYRLRWPVEEFYKLIQGDYLGQHQFHAQTVNGVLQEVHALALYANLSRWIMLRAAAQQGVPYEHLSQKGGFLSVQDFLTRLLLAPTVQRFTRWLVRLMQRIARALDPPRPGRSFPRRSYRPRSCWGPSGRTKNHPRPKAELS